MKYLGQPQSGSIANLTYSRNTFGQYSRARSGGGGSGDPYFATIVAAWGGTLTDAQRDGWDQYASWVPKSDTFGRKIRLSGFQAFVMANMNVSQATGPFLQATAPARPAEFTVTAVDITGWITSPFVGLSVSFTGLGAGHVVIWHKTTLPLLPGQRYLPQRGASWLRIWGSGGPAATDNVQVSGIASGQAVGLRWREFRPDWICGPWIHVRSPIRP